MFYILLHLLELSVLIILLNLIGIRNLGLVIIFKPFKCDSNKGMDMALNQKLFVDLLLNSFYINLLHDMITKGGKHFKVLVYTNIQLLQL